MGKRNILANIFFNNIGIVFLYFIYGKTIHSDFQLIMYCEETPIALEKYCGRHFLHSDVKMGNLTQLNSQSNKFRVE